MILNPPTNNAPPAASELPPLNYRPGSGLGRCGKCNRPLATFSGVVKCSRCGPVPDHPASCDDPSKLGWGQSNYVPPQMRPGKSATGAGASAEGSAQQVANQNVHEEPIQ